MEPVVVPATEIIPTTLATIPAAFLVTVDIPATSSSATTADGSVLKANKNGLPDKFSYTRKSKNENTMGAIVGIPVQQYVSSSTRHVKVHRWNHQEVHT